MKSKNQSKTNEQTKQKQNHRYREQTWLPERKRGEKEGKKQMAEIKRYRFGYKINESG